jgi:hypothetical protein
LTTHTVALTGDAYCEVVVASELKRFPDLLNILDLYYSVDRSFIETACVIDVTASFFKYQFSSRCEGRGLGVIVHSGKDEIAIFGSGRRGAIVKGFFAVKSMKEMRKKAIEAKIERLRALDVIKRDSISPLTQQLQD